MDEQPATPLGRDRAPPLRVWRSRHDASRVAAALLCILSAYASSADRRIQPPQADEYTVALLHFDDMQGNAATDASGHGHHAQLEATPRAPGWHSRGRYGACLAFDGCNDDGNGDKQGDADGLLWPTGTVPETEATGFTVEMWVRHAHLRGWQFYLLRRGAGLNYSLVAKQDRLYSGLRPTGGEWVEVWTPPCLQPDTWHHVALTYDRKTARLYCDGVERGSTAIDGAISGGNGHAIIGHDSDIRPTQIRGMCGLLDEIRVSNIARTEFPAGPHRPVQPLPEFLRQPTAQAHDFTEPTPVVRDVTVSGAVFDDANGNGERDAGEHGIAGVWVTDGEHITPSSGDGQYVFPFRTDEHRLVYLTLPNGYKATSPWYFLIRQQDADTSYAVDFALQRDPNSHDRDFAFLVTADSQFTSQDEGDLLKADMTQLTRTTGSPRFHFICGDLTMTGWLREWRWYADAMSELTIPSYDVFGGHGGNYGRSTPLKRGSVHHFNLFRGPSYYSWNYGGRHFLVFNSVAGSYLSDAGQERQRKWVEADLAMLESGSEVIPIAHHPLDLSQWRKDLKYVASFYGHWHENNLFVHNAVPYLCTNPIRGRDWGALTRTARFCRFEDGRLRTELRPTGQYKHVELVLPHEGADVPRGKLPLRVVAFDTASIVTGVKARFRAGTGPPVSVELERLGQFTWGSQWDTSALSPGTYELRLGVEDDRPEPWPERQCTFTVAARPMATGEPGDDWPMFFKSLDELRSTSRELKPPLDLCWSVPTGGRNQWGTSPIVYRGRVYVGPENMNIGTVEPSIQSYDAATGRRLWSTRVDACVRLSMAAGDGRVYAQTNVGTALCLDAETGRAIWQNALYPQRCSPANAKCAVLLHQGRLIGFGEYGPLTILDAETGKLLATWPRPGPGTRIYYGGPFPRGDRIFLATLWGAFACDALSGKVIWQSEVKGLVRRGVSTGIVHDGAYYVCGYAGTTALDEATGKTLWSVRDPVSGGVPVATVAAGVLYTGGLRLSALDAKTGQQLWKYDETRELDESNRRQTVGGFSSPLVSGNVVYVGRDDGDMIALDRTTGKRIWRFPLGLPVKSSPVISGNMLFVCDFDGNMHAFAAR